MIVDRRICLRAMSCGAAATLLSGQTLFAQAQSSSETAGADIIDQRTQKAIDSGLEFLARVQNETGSFNQGPYKENVAVVSLAGLAFMSEGSIPGQGKFSREMRRCLEFILASCQPNGFITARAFQSHGPMYGHGFAALFLAEVYGTAPSSEIREKLERAVSLIIDTQNEQGGWRYQPQRSDADISVTICQVMALRAARNAGIYVPNITIDNCIEYVKKSQNPDGGFMYLLDGGESAFPRSAAGIVALFSAGVYEGQEIELGLKYLMGYLPERQQRLRESHYFYGHYYAVQAMWHAGGSYWEKWYPAIREDLLRRQQSDGSWMDGISPEYGTAMACIILQMPNNYLPIFQR